VSVLLIVLGVIAHYVIGALWARSQITQCVQRARHHNPYIGERGFEESVKVQLLWRTLFPLYAIPFDLTRDRIRDWFFTPLIEREEHIERLRRDAQTLRDEARDEENERVRESFRMTAESLEAQADAEEKLL
jgi:hypothetical protein